MVEVAYFMGIAKDSMNRKRNGGYAFLQRRKHFVSQKKNFGHISSVWVRQGDILKSADALRLSQYPKTFVCLKTL